MLGYFITTLAIIGLFTVKKYPAASFFVWTCTNGFWMSANFAGGNNDQAVMFAAFVIACMIQFWRNLP